MIFYPKAAAFPLHADAVDVAVRRGRQRIVAADVLSVDEQVAHEAQAQRLAQLPAVVASRAFHDSAAIGRQVRAAVRQGKPPYGGRMVCRKFNAQTKFDAHRGAPMELLQELTDAELPIRVSNRADIDKLRILQAAGYILSDIPRQWHHPDQRESQGPATVFQVGPLGYKALRYFAPPKSHHSNKYTSAGFGVRPGFGCNKGDTCHSHFWSACVQHSSL
jgi:hypothetical protein